LSLRRVFALPKDSRIGFDCKKKCGGKRVREGEREKERQRDREREIERERDSTTIVVTKSFRIPERF
jgi:hypothetical protein